MTKLRASASVVAPPTVPSVHSATAAPSIQDSPATLAEPVANSVQRPGGPPNSFRWSSSGVLIGPKTGAGGSYSTTTDISRPEIWSAPKNFYSSMPQIIRD